MIYTLTVILLLVGAAASAIIGHCHGGGTGWPILRRWRRRQRAS